MNAAIYFKASILIEKPTATPDSCPIQKSVVSQTFVYYIEFPRSPVNLKDRMFVQCEFSS